MGNNREDQILEAEKLLAKAMLESDTDMLDKLLSANLIFTNHLGQVLGKNDDLEAHKSGLIHISNLSVDEQQVKLQQDTAVVFARVAICGNYAGIPANGVFRFTRVWQHADNRWEVIAAHSSVVTV